MLPNKPWWFWAQIALCALFLTPVWYFDYLPLNDLPNHVASVSLLLAQNDCGQTYVVPNPNQFIPNYTAFAIMEWLAPFLGVEKAARVVLSLYIILLPFSLSYFLKRVRPGLEPFGLAAFLYAYNWIFMMGFLNNALSLPLFLFAAGYWLSKKDGKPVLSAILSFAALSLLVFLTHIVAFAALIAFIAFMRLWERKSKLQNLLLELPSLVLPLLLSGALLFSLLKTQAEGHTVWGAPALKFFYLLISIPNAPFTLVFVCILATYIFIMHRGGFSYIKKADFRYLVLAALFSLALVIMPEHLPNWQFAGARLAPFIALFIFTGVLVAFIPADSRLINELLAAIFVFSLLSLAASFAAWAPASMQVRQAAELGEFFENNSAVLPVGQGFTSTTSFGVLPLFHVWGYWVVQKNAFVPYLFSHAYSPINYMDESMRGKDKINKWMDDLASAIGEVGSSSNCDAWRSYYSEFDWKLVSREYDYVVFKPGECDQNVTVPAPFKLVQEKNGYYVYKK